MYTTVGTSPFSVLCSADICAFCTVLCHVFLPASYLFNKLSLEMGILGCYNEDKKNTFSISFSFSYLSLFVDTPGSSGQRSRGSPLWGCPHRQCVQKIFIIVTALTRSVSFHCSYQVYHKIAHKQIAIYRSKRCGRDS